MKRVYIYSRISTQDKQDYTRQVEDLKLVCKNHGYKTNQIEVFAESISGYKAAKDRPELTRLLNLVEDNPSDVTVYTTEISRLGRNPSETRKIIDKLTDLGVPVYIQSLNQFTIENGKRNMTMNIILQVLIEYANLEAETFKARSKSGLLNSAKQGKAGGSNNHPYGYMKDEAGMLVINPDEVDVVKHIFNLYQQGQGIKAISTILNEQGVQTRTNKTHQGKTIKHKNFSKMGDKVKWSDKQIHDILKNTLYKGERRFKGEVIAAPAIISQELFDECQNLMKGKTHRNYLTTYTYLLKDKCTCGICQRNFFAKYKPVQGGDKAYVCSSKLITGGSCGNKGINISLIESAIYDLLLSSDAILKYINNTNDVQSVLQKELDQLNTGLPIIKKELDNKVKEQSRLLDVYLTGDITKTIYVAKNKGLESSIADIQQRVKLVENGLLEKKSALSNLKKTSTTKKMLENAKLNRELLKGIYNQLIHNITIIADTDMAEAHIRFQIGGVASIGQVRLLLDKKMINRSNKVFRYKAIFIKDIELDILDEDDNIFQGMDWIVIPEKHQLKVLDIQHG